MKRELINLGESLGSLEPLMLSKTHNLPQGGTPTAVFSHRVARGNRGNLFNFAHD